MYFVELDMGLRKHNRKSTKETIRIDIYIDNRIPRDADGSPHVEIITFDFPNAMRDTHTGIKIIMFNNKESRRRISCI